MPYDQNSHNTLGPDTGQRTACGLCRLASERQSWGAPELVQFFMRRSPPSGQRMDEIAVFMATSCP